MPNYIDLNESLVIAAQKNEPPFILLLDGIEDPHNFGAILRTAEAAGVHTVVIRKARQVPVTETVAKVSTGACDLVPICRVPNIAEAVSWLKKQEIVVIGVEIGGSKVYNKVDYKAPVALVIGSEGKGIARLVKERCSEIVSIPMQGKINSLNASVAAGIVLFEVLRQRT
ncbi:MAG: 23S rRNA (guanosine(2251)-2'-O)-methyltransferase RlmB [Candidatus Margulisbacteria bacterium]|nr:23S rRNA (guanosine(2251)-2'-O)-methyltransferase RlmB [Candidatus Margulisiibacteriota bacterium]